MSPCVLLRELHNLQMRICKCTSIADLPCAKRIFFFILRPKNKNKKMHHIESFLLLKQGKAEHKERAQAMFGVIGDFSKKACSEN